MARLANDQGSPTHNISSFVSFFSPLHHHHTAQIAGHSHSQLYERGDHHHHHLHQQFHKSRLLQPHHHHIQQALDPTHLHQTLQKTKDFQEVLPHDHEEKEEQQYHSSKEEENSSSGGPKSKKKAKISSARGDSHGELVSQLGKRSRGRPPGSKNKPKHPLIITQDSDEAMRPYILEIASGCDIAKCLASFVMRRQRGLCLLIGSGAVANVMLRQPLADGATVTYPGWFEILSLVGCYLPSPVNPGGLTISLVGSQGQVVGGSVVGVLLAASPVLIIATSFLNTQYERLPSSSQEEDTSNHGGMSNLHPLSNLNTTHSLTTPSSNPNLNPSNHTLFNINSSPSLANPSITNHSSLNVNSNPYLTPSHNPSPNNTNLNIHTNPHCLPSLNINVPNSNCNVNINVSTASHTLYLNHEPSSSQNMHPLFNPPMMTPLNCQLPQKVLAWATASTNQNPTPHHFMQ